MFTTFAMKDIFNFSVFLVSQSNSGKSNSGFTLVELLVVIIIISILSTTAIVTMFDSIKKAKQVEAVLHVSDCNKKQLLFYTENNRFTNVLGLLELQPESKNFIYQVEIYPPTEPEHGNETLACCMAAEKGGAGEMVFMCTSGQ